MPPQSPSFKQALASKQAKTMPTTSRPAGYIEPVPPQRGKTMPINRPAGSIEPISPRRPAVNPAGKTMPMPPRPPGLGKKAPVVKPGGNIPQPPNQADMAKKKLRAMRGRMLS